MKILFSAICLFATFSVSIAAQDNQPPAKHDSRQQISLQGGATITRKTTINGIRYEPTTSGDVSFGYRYRFTRWFSAEADYDVFRDTQKYQTSSGITAIGTNIHAASANAVITFGNPLSKKFESFITAGGGVLLYDPHTLANSSYQNRSFFVIGGGDDYLLSKHLRIRAQVQGLTYKAPDFGIASIHTDKYVQTVIPTIGVVWSF